MLLPYVTTLDSLVARFPSMLDSEEPHTTLHIVKASESLALKHRNKEHTFSANSQYLHIP